MNPRHIYRLALTFLAVWFLAAQSFSLAHASEHGENPHDHDGVVCTVTVLAEDSHGLLPEQPVTDYVLTTTAALYHAGFTSALYLKPQGRAPPPRAPPANL